MAEQSSSVYHEKQSYFNQLCLIHAINMILGEATVDKRKLDEVCETLSPNLWWNPHRSPLGLGNFDANVAMVVFDELGYETSFFDSRLPVKELPLQSCAGLLLNVKGTRFIPGSQHWIACKEVGNTWYLLDSRREGPEQIDGILEKIQSHVDSRDHILIVKEKAGN